MSKMHSWPPMQQGIERPMSDLEPVFSVPTLPRTLCPVPEESALAPGDPFAKAITPYSCTLPPSAELELNRQAEELRRVLRAMYKTHFHIDTEVRRAHKLQRGNANTCVCACKCDWDQSGFSRDEYGSSYVIWSECMEVSPFHTCCKITNTCAEAALCRCSFHDKSQNASQDYSMTPTAEDLKAELLLHGVKPPTASKGSEQGRACSADLDGPMSFLTIKTGSSGKAAQPAAVAFPQASSCPPEFWGEPPVSPYSMCMAPVVCC